MYFFANIDLKIAVFACFLCEIDGFLPLLIPFCLFFCYFCIGFDYSIHLLKLHLFILRMVFIQTLVLLLPLQALALSAGAYSREHRCARITNYARAY